jgi:hypothetical protein
VSIVLWAASDWFVYRLLHSGRTIEHDDDDDAASEIAAFARPLPAARKGQGSRRPFMTWLYAWLGREGLAFPIWAWAIWGGVSVTWRDRRFWVGMDMKVHEIHDRKGTQENGKEKDKDQDQDQDQNQKTSSMSFNAKKNAGVGLSAGNGNVFANKHSIHLNGKKRID